MIIFYIPSLILGLILPFLHGFIISSIIKESPLEKTIGWNFYFPGFGYARAWQFHQPKIISLQRTRTLQGIR